MNKKTTTGSFSKVWKLITVLQKCNGKGVIGGKDALISPAAAKILAVTGLVLLTGAIGLVAFFTEPFIAQAIEVMAIAKSLMLMMLLVSFMLSVKNVVTVLYTADDLAALLPMPFSANQIVAAKLAVTLRFPLGLSMVVLNSVCLGLGLRAGKGAAFIAGTLLSGVMIPVTGLAIAALLVVVAFRVFGFIRNRDITAALGGLFTLAITVAYIIISNRLRNNGSSQAAAAMTAFASVSDSFPNISFMTRFMAEGSVLWLLLSLAVSLAAMALAMLAVRLFYLSTALAMQSTGTGKKAVSKGALSGKKQADTGKALFSCEAKLTRRNPAYMIYGFAMTFIWPLMIVLPFVFGNSSFDGILRPPISTGASLLCAVSLGLAASGFACGFNNLAVTAFTREGSNFSALKAMPLDFKAYYNSKRNLSLLVCSLGSVLYIIILGVVCLMTGFITIQSSWTVLCGAVIAFLSNIIIINCMLLKNAKKPRFDWDSETEFSRRLTWMNVVAIAIGTVAFIAFFIALLVPAALGENGMILPLAAGIFVLFAAALAATAFAVSRAFVRIAEKSLMAVE